MDGEDDVLRKVRLCFLKVWRKLDSYVTMSKGRVSRWHGKKETVREGVQLRSHNEAVDGTRVQSTGWWDGEDGGGAGACCCVGDGPEDDNKQKAPEGLTVKP